MNNWKDLSAEQKSSLMKLYLKNGITSLSAMKEHYNSLQDGGKLTFKQWKEKMQQKYPDIEMDNNKAGYNYNEYFKNHYDDAIKQLSNLQHFPDTYKLPNHPTFSNESIYSRGPVMGGSWINDSTFTPSVINRQYYPNVYKEDRNYTEREIYKYQKGGKITADLTPLNLQRMYANNPKYGDNRYMDTVMLRNIDNYMISKGVGLPQRQAIAFTVHQEGNTTGAHGNGAFGLVGWRDVRAANLPKSTKGQAAKLYQDVYGEFNADNWNHGGKGSGYKSGKAAQQAFQNAKTASEAAKALNYGYVRPPLEDRKKRTSNVEKMFKADGGDLGIITSLGQWQYPHQITTIPSTDITMQGVNYPVIGISDLGDIRIMQPNKNYKFKGNYVTEYPI